MDLTLISFVIAIVGIVLQIADAFPEHREARKTIVIMSFGLFMGVLTNAVAGAKYEVSGDFDSQYALIFLLAGAFVIFGLITIYLKSDEAAWMTLGAGALFIIAGLAVAVAKGDPRYSYSTDEVLLLANDAQRRGQFEIAIERLEELRRRLPNTSAAAAVQTRIDKLEAAQAGTFTGNAQQHLSN